jgi:hypothetical protein
MKKAPQNYDIFLSHNHADEEWTGKLAARLEKEKWRRRKLRVFFSPWDIKPGQYFPEKIEQAIQKSRKVAVVMSPPGVKSTWVQLERLVATYISIEERDDRLIPLYRRKCKVPGFLGPVVYIDFRDDSKFEDNYQRLVAVIRDEPLPRVPGEVPTTDISGSTTPTTKMGDGGNNKRPKDEDRVRDKLRILRQLEKEELISEGITQEYQIKILDVFFGVGKRPHKS